MWFAAGDDRLSTRARALIEDASNERFLSIASVWEMAIKHSLGKLVVSPSFADFIAGETKSNMIGLQPIELAHVAKVIDLPFHHRDPFDRLLAAQCLIEDWDLISADEILDSYGVRRVW